MTMRNAVLILLAIALAGCAQPREPEARKPLGAEAAGAASDFTVPSLTGVEGDISLNAMKGHVILLDFWATWCPPCRAELPTLSRIYTDLRDRGFLLVGMTVDQGKAQNVAEAVGRFRLSYPTALAGPQVQAAYGGIRAVPTKFLIDKDGNVRKRYVGVVPEEELRADIEVLLKEFQTL